MKSDGPAWLLAFYPREWRERYGQELLALIEAEAESGRVSLRMKFDVIGAGLAQRLRSSGLRGDELPPEARVRAGLLLVLCSWSAFVVAGVGLQKSSEHWQAATPLSGQALPRAAFDTILLAAAIGSTAIVVGVLLVARPLIALVRSGGWQKIRQPLVRAVSATGLTAAALVAIVIWAHHLSSTQRNGGDVLYSAAFLGLAACGLFTIAAWTGAAVTTARHLPLPSKALRRETWLAALVTMTMATITVATTIWWTAVAGTSSNFFGTGFPWTMLALTLTMLGAAGLGLAGTLRAIRT
jgi:hypothetical protein